MYQALIDIGDYKKGDTVPKEQAELWMKMYKFSPVKLIGKSEPKKKEEEEVEEKSKSSDAMLDDYLNRNTNVVKTNIEKDELDNETLAKLLDLEKSNKKRKSVINAIEFKIKKKSH